MKIKLDRRTTSILMVVVTVVLAVVTVLIGQQLQQSQAPDDAAAASCTLGQPYAGSGCNAGGCSTGYRHDLTCKCPAGSTEDFGVCRDNSNGGPVDAVLVGSCVADSSCSTPTNVCDSTTLQSANDCGGGTCTAGQRRVGIRVSTINGTNCSDVCQTDASCNTSSSSAQTNSCSGTCITTSATSCAAINRRNASGSCYSGSICCGARITAASNDSESSIESSSTTNTTTTELPSTAIFSDTTDRLLFGIILIVMGVHLSWIARRSRVARSS